MVNVEPEAVDFEPENDYLMDDDDASPNRTTTFIHHRLKSAITFGGSKKTKGRGFHDEVVSASDSNARMSVQFDSLDSDGGPGPERCKFNEALNDDMVTPDG